MRMDRDYLAQDSDQLLENSCKCGIKPQCSTIELVCLFVNVTISEII